MDDEAVAQFVSFTSSTTERARQYLHLTDGNVQQAINIFFANDGNDPSGTPPVTQTQASPLPSVPPQPTQTWDQGLGYEDEDGVVHIDSDLDISDGENIQESDRRTRASRTGASRPTVHTPSTSTPPVRQFASTVDEDEAMARRLQEEFYGASGLGGEVGPDGVRAPIGRTTETLVGAEAFDVTNEAEMRAAVQEQLRTRQRIRPRGKYST